MPQPASSQPGVGDAVLQRLYVVLGSQRSKFTLERLRSLYVNLLHSIDIANDDIGRRSLVDSDKLLSGEIRRGTRGYANFFRFPLGFDRNSASKSSKSSITDTRTTRRDLSAAFRVLSATPSAQKEGSNGGAVAVRDNAAVSSLALARAHEARVAQLIRAIGEVVVYGEQNSATCIQLRSDGVFEYFCEKSIISLLVDIVKAKPAESKDEGKSPRFHAVAWTPVVKAQVLKTVSMLISKAQDPTLYYLLSNNYVNELIRCMLPMRQWTEPALEEMVPVYVSFLKTLALKLSTNPDLFPFLKWDESNKAASCPLFAAAMEVSASSFAQSHSAMCFTCLNLLVNMLQIQHPPVRSWVSAAETEQRLLAEHLCRRLLDGYDRLAHLTTGPVVDAVRSSAITGQLKNLNDQYEYLNDVLWCGVRTLNVRICETLLQRVVGTLLRNLVNRNREQRLCVGAMDDDEIPESEALAQVSTLLLSQLFDSLEYAPFLRMLAVAILHPASPNLWSSPVVPSESYEYTLTPALNAIVSGESVTDTVANTFRNELMEVLRGEAGDWRFIPAAMLLESVLKSDALDLDMLRSLNVIPRFKDQTSYPESLWEDRIKELLNRTRQRASSVSTVALECGGSIALTMLSCVVRGIVSQGEHVDDFDGILRASPLVRGLAETRSMFCSVTRKLQCATGVSEHFVDLIELAIASRYSLRDVNANDANRGARTYVCSLSRFACTSYSRSSEILVRRYRHVSSNDVEDTRFALRMALHFRGICNVVESLLKDLGSDLATGASSLRWSRDKMGFEMDDVADQLVLAIGGLKEKPACGTDLDVRGRTTFRFSISAGRQELANSPAVHQNETERKRKYSEDIFRLPSPDLLLVMDPTDLFIVNPAASDDEYRGTILCSTSLASVIAFAPDGEWLHVAVRNMEDVGCLVKNGNMALRFESAGTCLVVREYLERARRMLQKDLEQKIHTLLDQRDGTGKTLV